MASNSTLLADVKTALSIRDSATPTTAETARSGMIQGFIDACLEDLKQAGITDSIIEDEGAFVTQACILYCRAQMSYLNKGEEWLARYTGFRDGYAMRQDYITEEDS